MAESKSKSFIQKEDARDLIMAKMTAEGRTMKWLSEITSIEYNYLYNCLVRQNFNIKQEVLDSINKVLETNFTLPE